MSGVGPPGYKFRPAPGSSTLSDESQYTLDLFYQKLCHYRTQLPANVQQKLTKSDLKELSQALLDGTVFEIVKELEDIQQLSERDLLNKRIKVVSSQKTQKMAQAKQHAAEMADCKPHTVPLVKTRHQKEKTDLDSKLKEELKSTDQTIILELDQLVTDQQSTMHQAAVPLFMVTNNPADIQLQMHLLKFIQKLSQLPRPVTDS